MAFLNFMTRQLLANRELCNLDARTFCTTWVPWRLFSWNPGPLSCVKLWPWPQPLLPKPAGDAPSNAAARPVSLNRHSNSSLDSTSTFGEYSNAIIILWIYSVMYLLLAKRPGRCPGYQFYSYQFSNSNSLQTWHSRSRWILEKSFSLFCNIAHLCSYFAK